MSAKELDRLVKELRLRKPLELRMRVDCPAASTSAATRAVVALTRDLAAGSG